MKLILFCGPDGSGKSTIARLLNLYLKNKGFSAHISWIRGSHTFASFLARILRRFKIFQGSDNPYYDLSIPQKVTCLWVLIEFISVLPLILSRYMLKSLLCITIGERSPLDFIVWVIATTGDIKFVSSLYGKFIISLAIKWNTIYICAPLEVLCHRRPRECQFIKRTLPIYEVFSNYFNLPKIENSKDIKSVFREILEIVYDKGLKIF